MHIQNTYAEKQTLHHFVLLSYESHFNNTLD